MRLMDFSMANFFAFVLLILFSSPAESSLAEVSPSEAHGTENHVSSLSSPAATIVDTNPLHGPDIETSPVDMKSADLHFKPEGVLQNYQRQLRGNQRRRLPGGVDSMDFSSPEAQSALILVVIVLLLLCCCCRGGRRGGCSLCDILACVCIYEMCCDNDGAPLNDFISF